MEGMIEENGMYRLILSDGVSILYNLTRATEFINRLKDGECRKEIRIGYEVVD